MNMAYFPKNTAVAVKVEKLFKVTDKRLFSERMSSRMVKCASVLDIGSHIGWQMDIPVRGLARISAFGSDPLCKGDLDWMLEKTGKTAKRFKSGKTDSSLKELYEVYLPVAENSGSTSSIGFGTAAGVKAEDGFSRWPAFYSSQFEEMIRVLQITGAALRVVLGPASEEEQIQCRKRTLRTYDVRSVPSNDYIGRPVRVRALLRLKESPSVRLKSIIEESVKGAKLRRIGTMDEQLAADVWNQPLDDSAVLPDYAARILMMEPEARETIVGIEVCEEEAKKLPASHRNTRNKRAVTIGRATDTAGIRRTITIGEVDLKRHYQIVGQTGTGKSTLLITLILSAIERGHGLTFFDPHGSTIDVVLKSVPAAYADRIRVVRIGDTENPVPLNIWDSDNPAKEERTINDLCDLFGDIFDPRKEGILGPRWERWFATFAKASIAFLGRRASLESISVISQSQDNMLKVSKAIFSRYPELVETIKQEYGTDRSSDFQSMLNWCLCKFQRLTAVEQLRRTLGAGANALDFNRTIDTNRVTLIDLASPAIGTHAARIIGTILLMKLWNAAMLRANRDMTHLVVVDEVSLFQTNPMPRMLAESRKFGISMVLCHQHTGQLTTEIREALEANSANFSAFRLSPGDAATAAVRFNDPEMQVSLTRLDAFNAITSISVDGKQTSPFTLETIRPRQQSDGETIAGKITARSIETMVKPYRSFRALTSAEILDLLNHPEKVADQNPAWLQEWTRRRKEIKRVV